jgi:broad specificity phosphatase PhoE
MPEKNFQSRPSKDSLRLFLVRHGETDANRNRLLQGISNGMLNSTGMLQVCKLGEHLQTIALDHVWASDLQRAVDTASAVAQLHAMKVETDSQLREWNVGEMDGQPALVYLKMIKDSGKPLSFFDPPGGEKLGNVRKRADGIVEKLVKEHMGEAVLICSHGDFMRMLVGSLLQIDVDSATAFHFDNASYSVFEYIDNHWKVFAINRIADCD